MILKEFYEDNHSNAISKLRLYGENNLSQKAVFCDRDGVLINDVGHIDSINKVILCRNVIPFLEKAKEANFDIVVITNQSSISRKIISYEEYLSITESFLSKLPKDLYPRLILASFHLQDNSNNLPNFEWRKPGKGMFNYVLKEEMYDVDKSIMIGDKFTDLLPAYNSNIRNLIYVQSSLHKDEIQKINKWNKKNKNLINISNMLDPEYFVNK